jgi:hypothetical protein
MTLKVFKAQRFVYLLLYYMEYIENRYLKDICNILFILI